MILLNFTVRNHKSIRDEVTLDLVRPSLRTLQPKDGDWFSVTYPIISILGGNATGKSALLDALHYTFAAIRLSSTSWQAERSMVRQPFALDGTTNTSSSYYEIDFILTNRRYNYGFEVDKQGIKREWLRDIPNSRWRSLFQRDRDSQTFKFHPAIETSVSVTARELILSRALMLEDSILHEIASALVSKFDCVLVKDSHRERRLSKLVDSLVEGTISYQDLEALLQIADIGVSKIRIEESSIPEGIRRTLKIIQRGLIEAEQNENEESEQISDPDIEIDDDDLQQVVRQLLFTHNGLVEDCPPFPLSLESDGTIAWLALSVPALETLRQGGLLLVDELDASLHPHLLELLLMAFANPKINVKHAQLIFTTHESYVLSPLSDIDLEPEQVWFTDKTYEGITELTCLADFPIHRDANIAKRYLVGRYGGTPRLAPHSFAALISSGGS